MAGHMRPVHIQPNVTISGSVCSSYQEHQIASPWGCFTELFADLSVGARALQRNDAEALSSRYKLPALGHVFLESTVIIHE